MRKISNRLPLFLFVSMLLTGCGTVLSRASDPYASADGQSGVERKRPSKIYSGATLDVKSFTPENSIIVLVDFPFSVAADTLLLPLTIYEQFIAENELQAAAAKGDISTVNNLLEHGANINAKDAYGYTALMTAAWAGRSEAMKFLLDKGATVNEQNRYSGATALMYSVNVADNVQLLLNSGANVQQKNKYGRTALMIAADMSNAATVKLLLDHGADVNAKDEDGRTALAVVILNKKWQQKRDMGIAQLLLDKGSDIKVQDNDGFTLFDYALGVYDKGVKPSLGGDADAISLLLNNGANPNSVGHCYRTPMMVAAEVSNQAAARLLLEKKAEVNFKVQKSNIWWCSPFLKGKTALMLATERGNTGMVELLKNAGAVE